MKVILVNMPFVGIARPSIGLGLLKARLMESGISTVVLNANLILARRLGLKRYRAVSRYTTEMVGEWLFSDAAFPNQCSKLNEYAAWIREKTLDERTVNEIEDDIGSMRAVASSFLQELCDQILSYQPMIVGCTSMFHQHMASLGLLRLLAEKDGSIVTMVGGANCEMEMGLHTSRIAPWIDVVVSGEADELIVPLCRSVIENTRKGLHNFRTFQGIYLGSRVGNQMSVCLKESRAECMNLQRSPMPDYDEYFDDVKKLGLQTLVEPVIPLETSRGCWWGELSHCIFCGLNGVAMKFRVKESNQIRSEVNTLLTRYEVPRIGFVDNILARNWQTSIQAGLELEGDNSHVNFFFETKSGLTCEEVDKLRDLAVVCIQPGIESLITGVLKIIGKGVRAINNIRLLQYCAEAGIEVKWSMLWGFPGEELDWYEDLLRLLPNLFHLQPPGAISRVEYHRFSPFHKFPDKYGLSLRPAQAYQHIYPSKHPSIEHLAYLFENEKMEDSGGSTVIAALRRSLDAWQRNFSFEQPTLYLWTDGAGHSYVDDSRSGSVKTIPLEELQLAVLDTCYGAPLWSDLQKHYPRLEYDHMRSEVFEPLVRQGLIVEIDGRYLSLPLRNWRGFPHGGHYAPFGRVL